MKGKIIRSTGRGSEEGARRKKHKVSPSKLQLIKLLGEVNDKTPFYFLESVQSKFPELGECRIAAACWQRGYSDIKIKSDCFF